MNENMNGMVYKREKKVTVKFDGITQEFTLVAPSARDRETALLEAQQIHAQTVKVSPQLAESLRTVYLVQEVDVLVAAMLETERDQFLRKAAMALVEGDPEYDAKLATKADLLAEARRVELSMFSKEQLADKLASLEVNRQLEISLFSAGCFAILARVLREDDGTRLFQSVDAMKEAFPAEVLEKLCEALTEFLSERGNAQVFPKPHISNG